MMKCLIIHFILMLISLSGISLNALAQPWYVAINGSDTGSGSEQNPFLTIGKAVSKVQAGETIFVKGGTYNLTTTVVISKSGTGASVISLFAYPGTRPVLNISGQSMSSSNYGIKLTGNYWHIKGIDITGAGDNGMKIEGGSFAQ